MTRRFGSSAVVAVAVSVFLLSATSISAQTWDCGDPDNVGGASSVQCVLDVNGRFTVSGAGAMANYFVYHPGRPTILGDDAAPPWYYLRNSITSLVIEEGVTRIGNYTFYLHINLIGSLVIPNSVTTIGHQAFYGCSGFTGSLTIGNSVTTIGDAAFAYCSGFTGSLVIPNSVTSIGWAAFSGCSGFTGSLTIGNSVTTIGDAAFANCSGFTGSLVIPNSVTTIGWGAFSGCSGFTGSLVIPNSVTTIGHQAFYGCSGFTGSLTIGNSVTTIGAGAFANCRGFTGSLVIPSSVTTIENEAFQDCSGFTGDLIIPNSVTTIGDWAFQNCSGFTGSLTIGNSVTTIGERAFLNCSGFTGSLTIGNSVTTIGNQAFSGCSGFTGNLVIPNSVTTIGGQAFSGCSGFTGSLVIPNSVTTIGERAFLDCSGFTGSLTIGNSVTTIGSNAFRGCSGFTGSLVIPNSVTTIGHQAFYGCSGFTGSLTIGNSVTTIGSNAFRGCSGFTGIDSYMRDLTNVSTSAFNDITNKPLTCDTDMSYAHRNAIGNYNTPISSRPFTPTLAIVDNVTQVSIGEAFTISIDFRSAPSAGLTSDILTVTNATVGPLTYTGYDVDNFDERLPVENIVGTVTITPTGGNITAQIAESAFGFFRTRNSKSNIITMNVDIATVVAAPLTGVVSPVTDAVPSTNINDGIGFTAALIWDGAPTVFDHNTAYTATVMLTAATGYTFTGAFANTNAIAWFTVNGIAPIWVNNSGSALVFKVTFPKTAIKAYTVTYYLDGGTQQSGAWDSYTYGAGLTLPTTPTKTGYTFGGWFDNANLTGTAVTAITATAMDEKVFWAKWTVNNYTVTYNLNGGTQQSGAWDNYTYGTGLTLPTTPTKTGHTFGGWYDNTGFTGTAITAISTTATGDMEFWAKWVPIPVTDISGIPTTIVVETQVYLTGIVVPSNAANQTIIWSIASAGNTGAGIFTGNVLFAHATGTVIVRATIAGGNADGTDFVKDFFITVSATTAITSDDRNISQSKPDAGAAVVPPVNVSAFEVSVGPNPVCKSGNGVNIFITGKRIDNGTLTVYDASGNVVGKVNVKDNHPAPLGHPAMAGNNVNGNVNGERRIIGTWDLRDAKGRAVPEGTYLLRGTVKTVDGKRERVSVVVGVR